MSARQQSVELKLKAFDESASAFNSYTSRLRQLEQEERSVQAKLKATGSGREGPDTSAVNRLAQVRAEQDQVRAAIAAEAQAERAKEIEAAEAQNGQRIADIRTQINARQLRDAKQFSEAEILELQAAHSKELAQLDRFEQERLSHLTAGENAAGAEQLARLRASSAELRRATEESQRLQIEAVRRKASPGAAPDAAAEAETQAKRAKEIETVEAQTGQRVADIRTEIAARELRQRKQFAEAEVLELQYAHVKQLAEIDRFEKEKLAHINAGEASTKDADLARTRAAAVELRRAAEENHRSQIAAVHQGSGTALSKLRELQLEQRKSGEKAFEHLVKGGGVAAIYVLALEAAAAATKDIDEGLARVADGSRTVGRGFRESLSALGEHTPVIKEIVEYDRSLIGVEGSIISLLEQRLGVSREIAESNIANQYRMEAEKAAVAQLSAEYSELAVRMRRAHNIGDLPHGLNRQIAEMKAAVDDAHQTEVKKLETDIRDPGASTATVEAAKAELKGLLQQIGKEKAQKKDELSFIANREAEEEARQHGQRMLQIEAAGRSATYKEAAASAEAEITLLRQKYATEISDLNARAQKESLAHAERRPQIVQERDESVSKLRHAQADDEARIRRTDQERRAEEAASFADRIGAINTTSAATRLRIQHRDAEAEMLELRESHQRELAEIERHEAQKLAALRLANVQTQAKYYPQITSEESQARNAENSKFEAETRRLHQQQADAATDRQARTENELLEARVGLLRTLAQGGNTLAGQEAERLEAMAQTEAKIAEINKQLREGADLTAEQKRNLQGALGINQQRVQDLKAEETTNREKSLAQAKIDVLHSLGQSGNKQAEREAELAEIRIKAEQKIAAVRKQLAGETNAENKKALQEELTLAQQKENIDLANAINKGTSAEFKGAPGEEAGRGVRGFKAAADVLAHNADYEFRQRQLRDAGIPPTPADPRQPPGKPPTPADPRQPAGGGKPPPVSAEDKQLGATIKMSDILAKLLSVTETMVKLLATAPHAGPVPNRLKF